MPRRSSTTSVSNEERRWVVIGVCLTKVLTPALRDVLATEIPKWHQVLCQPPTNIDKQVYRGRKVQLNPSTLHLNYKNINNNDALRSPRAFDYAVKDPLALAKLFVLPFMCKFTGFDEMDTSAVLSVICEAAPFVGAFAHAKTVRSDIRNEWAHGNFKKWTEAKFKAAFQNMETLLKNVNLSPNDEQKLCDELNNWKDKGLQLYFGQSVDNEILTLLRGEMDELCEAVQSWTSEKGQMTTLLSNISEIQSNLKREVGDLRMAMKRCATQTDYNSKKIKLLDDELSRYHIKEEEKIPYVFNAPSRNRYFAGRTEEIQELKRILKVEETSNEKKLRVAAVCGLGGIGKTSLVSEYAHQMKDFYKGGVYWFSAEDDERLSRTVETVAAKIRAQRGSFHLSLAYILEKISTVHDPCLIVLDCLDQLELSSNMVEFLSFPSQENILGHFIVLTRRNPKRLVDDVSVFVENFCLQLKCLQSEEAKQFLFSRTNVTRDENVESVADCLCEELGRLPLALEQAGAYIQTRCCSFALYLEQYKAKRLSLLSRQRARAAGNDSPERLAVHTTWLINIEYIENSPDGQAAVRFMNACSFFDGNGIEEELINVGTPEVEDVAFRKCVSSPLGCREVLKLLTDFSLFTYVKNGCVSTHCLVQELVWGNLDPASKAESVGDAVRLLSYAFSDHPSPSNHVSLDERNAAKFIDLPNCSDYYYMWSKFCIHGHHLRRKMEGLLETLDSVWFPETAKILYECAFHLSANHQQVEAKRTLNFAYRILDWLPLAEYETLKDKVSNNLLFPLPIPLPQFFHKIMIQRYCIPPPNSLKTLAEKPASEASDLAPEASDLAPEASDLASEASDLTPEASDLVPEVSDLAPDKTLAEKPASEASDLAPEASDLASEASDLTPEASDLVPEVSDLAPETSDLAPEAGFAFEASDLAPEAYLDPLAAFFSTINLAGHFPFVESFMDLPKRIFKCDSVDELRKALFSQEVETGALKVLVLGAEEYILNSDTVDKPWNNCILVGARKNCSVSLKSNYDISLLKCMLSNLSFGFGECTLKCLPDSFVGTLNCNFTCCGNDVENHMIDNEGMFIAKQCNFTGSRLCCYGQSRSVVRDCSFCNNTVIAVYVCESGTLTIKDSRMYNNGINGLKIEDEESKCDVINCHIYGNGGDGIQSNKCNNLTLTGNKVYNNRGNGIYTVDSVACIRDNKLHDNGEWGIVVRENPRPCIITNNEIRRNKTGGVSMPVHPDFSPSDFVHNIICHNNGPAVDEEEFKSLDNEMHHNDENDRNLIFSIQYCSCCRVECKLAMCGKCFTSAYCSESCKKDHYSKHKEICKVLRERSSYLITCTEEPEKDAEEFDDPEEVDDLEEVVPKLPPRDDMRFVVKVGVEPRATSECTLHLLDRYHKFRKKFDSEVIDELLREFGGVDCEEGCIDKRLFFHCLLEDNDQLRIFTNEFAEFQNW